MFSKTLDPSFVARGLTLGAAVATFFGTLWVIDGINALQGPSLFTLPIFAALALLTLSLVVACVRLLTTASLFPVYGDQQVVKQANWYINVATVIQIVVSVVGPGLLILWGHSDLAFPATVVSVGLYLLALAPLLRLPHFYIVGGLLCGIPIASIWFVPATIGTLQNWTVINGIACGLVFLGSGLTNMLLTVRIRRGQYQQNWQHQSLV